MEHRRPNGDLAQGWFCAKCGEPVPMLGHLYRGCKRNLKLVIELQMANSNPAHIKPHFKYKEKS